MPVFGTKLDDDIVATAGRLAAAESEDADGEGESRLELIYVIEVPLTEPLDAALPPEREAQARRALERAREVGEEYEDVEVSTEVIRARKTGAGIVEAARRLGSEAIVIGSVAYLKGNAAALQVDLLYPLRRADAYANRWISFTPKDEPYQLIVRLVLGTTSWAKPTEAPLDSLPERPNSISRPSTVDGRSVESVTSTIDDVVASTDSSFVGHAQVFFPADSPKLPYRLTDDTTGTEAGSPGKVTVMVGGLVATTRCITLVNPAAITAQAPGAAPPTRAPRHHRAPSRARSGV